MKWATYRPLEMRDDPGAERVGLVLGEELRGLQPGVRLLDLLGDDGEKLADAAERAQREPADVRDLRDAQLCPLLRRPPSIRDFSVFEQHIRSGLEAMGLEVGQDWYEIPCFNFTSPNMMYGSGETVTVPGNTQQMDFELEIAAIIGKAGINLGPEEAEQHIAGYAVFNDWSARDLQFREMNTVPVGPSKGKDFAMSLGPYLVTPDELEDRRKNRSFDLRCRAFVNGKQYSDGNVSDMWYGFNEIVSYASRGVWLEPGDVLGSGTCATGCILEQSRVYGLDEYPWLAESDEVVLEVEILGQLRNRVTWGPMPKPFRTA